MHETKKRKRKCGILTRSTLEKMPELLEAYLATCRPPGEERSKKGTPPVFPNLAGFCRWLGCGIGDAEKLRRAKPDLYDRICAVLEDEALNSDLSASVLNAYLKMRLGYKDESAEDEESIRLIFEHDIAEDGK